LRWHHPTRGTIPPDEFVALAERTGLIRPLTRWVVDHALRQCRAWLDAGFDIPVAVNASMHDVHDVNLPDEIARLLDKWRVPPGYLRVEVTEGTLMADTHRALEVLGRLRSLGIEIAVDDFGTGYSSLAYLGRLPVNELKIDRSFVGELHTNAPNAAIVRSTITLGHDLGLRVVAEGVEDEATWRVLQRFGCDAVQGYWVSRPLAATALVEWLLTSGWTAGKEPHLLAA
jgi:EAL domain-containing protein (putative c-di-GMP-specific phosphodiesterase class I)